MWETGITELGGSRSPSTTFGSLAVGLSTRRLFSGCFKIDERQSIRRSRFRLSREIGKCLGGCLSEDAQALGELLAEVDFEFFDALDRPSVLRVVLVEFIGRMTREAAHALRPDVACERIENAALASVSDDRIGYFRASLRSGWVRGQLAKLWVGRTSDDPGRERLRVRRRGSSHEGGRDLGSGSLSPISMRVRIFDFLGSLRSTSP